MMLLKKFIPALFLCFLSIMACCQDDSKVGEYIRTYKELAIKEMLRTGVPASITLAQGILESQSGESDLAKKSNNHFGIKCKPEWTGDKVYHDDDARGECFRRYDNPEQSYIDHSDFLKNRPYYTFLFKLDPTDYEAWAKGLKKAGYATSPTYAQKLIGIIEKYNLQDYTMIALQKRKEDKPDLFAYTQKEDKPVVVSTAKQVADTVKPTVTSTAAPVEPIPMHTEQEKPKQVIIPAVLYRAADYPEGPFTINGAKVILAKEGTSLLALADGFGVSYKKLLEFNELEESTDILGYDQLVFLARKSKKGNKDTHTVEQNETMEVIAQKEGVQLESLLAYNRIPKGRQPVTGEKIYLRSNSPVTPKLVSATPTN